MGKKRTPIERQHAGYASMLWEEVKQLGTQIAADLAKIAEEAASAQPGGK